MTRLYLGGLAVVVAVVLYATSPTCAESGCGLAPLKPLVPLGCSDIVARCQCEPDAQGDLQCVWVWDCITD
jgi:hypothetical protein